MGVLTASGWRSLPALSVGNMEAEAREQLFSRLQESAQSWPWNWREGAHPLPTEPGSQTTIPQYLRASVRFRKRVSSWAEKEKASGSWSSKRTPLGDGALGSANGRHLCAKKMALFSKGHNSLSTASTHMYAAFIYKTICPPHPGSLYGGREEKGGVQRHRNPRTQ